MKAASFTIVTLAMVALATAAVLFGAGCSQRMGADSESVGPSAPELAPADGAVGVALDAPIVLQFNRPVDRQAVERSLVVWNEAEMPDSLCQGDSMHCCEGIRDMMGGMGGHMEGGGHMGIAGMTAMTGTFEWNSSSTGVTFRPAVPWSHGSRYCVHYLADTAAMDGSRAIMMAHFCTADASSETGGHEQHH